MSAKPPSEVTTDELDDGFMVVTATIRNKKYVVREMTAAEYQKCVDAAKEKDPDTGLETTNQDVLARLMLDKAIIEPKMTVVEIMKQPTTVVFKLNSIVTEMHYTILQTDEEKAEAEAEAEEEDEGEATG